MAESMKLADLSDREVLLVVRDVADGEGWCLAADVGERFGISEAYRRRVAAGRLAWLARYGAVEREHAWDEHGNPVYTRAGKPRYTQRWRLTPLGEAIAKGELKAQQERVIGQMSDVAVLLTLGQFARRARGSQARKLLEREWRHYLIRE